MRYSRQTSVINPETMASLRFMIIGCGAIGRQVAIQLAAAGAKHFQLWDFDTVEEPNIVTQGWKEKDLGRHKVYALADEIMAIDKTNNPMIFPFVFNNSTYRFECSKRDMTADVVVCAVDSISTRKDIFELMKNQCELFVDGRMTAEACRIIAVSGSIKNYYTTTLFSPEEAYAGVCTARATIYCSNIAGGLLVSMITRWMRQKAAGVTDEVHDFMLNIPNYTVEDMTK